MSKRQVKEFVYTAARLAGCNEEDALYLANYLKEWLRRAK